MAGRKTSTGLSEWRTTVSVTVIAGIEVDVLGGVFTMLLTVFSLRDRLITESSLIAIFIADNPTTAIFPAVGN
jgi:hypothetical protein